MAALSELYLQRLVRRGRDEGYVENRRCLLRKWVLPVIGEVLVSEWGTEESELVQVNAAPHLSPSRLEDLGSALSGLRLTAWLRRPGGRWLAKDEDPLEGVSFSWRGQIQGADRKYIAPHLRPSTTTVVSAVAAARVHARWPWMGVCVSVAAFCALRLGEQLALRAIDVDLVARRLEVNGTWKVARHAPERGATRPRWRSPHPKNKLWRHAPYLGSQHAMLVEACRVALGMAGASEEELVAVIAAERERRAALTKSGDWRDFGAPAEQEAWLFPDESGVPPTKEGFNDAWHQVRDRVGWNPRIPYKNLRHHAALYWHEVCNVPWVTIAAWDGHDVRTLTAYYVLPVEDATEQARGTLDGL